MPCYFRRITQQQQLCIAIYAGATHAIASARRLTKAVRVRIALRPTQKSGAATVWRRHWHTLPACEEQAACEGFAVLSRQPEPVRLAGDMKPGHWHTGPSQWQTARAPDGRHILGPAKAGRGFCH